MTDLKIGQIYKTSKGQKHYAKQIGSKAAI